ncbi:MAG: hydroxymethylbilane synthase, partial [Spirochaetales bacterium]|nr:hydroxymethylbilane synthase [Spirochaetales bacterium]
MIREIKIGGRDSTLALAQTRFVAGLIARACPDLRLRIVSMKTRGDLMPDTPFEEIPERDGKALFTGALEKALVAGEIDLCVHSMKDLSVNLDGSLPVVGVPVRGDPRDMLVLPADSGAHGGNGAAVGSGAREILGALDESLPVGCSSLRRRIQLLSLVPGLNIASIRGNVPTRLSKMDTGQYGSLVLAAVGLERLGIERRGYVFSVQEMLPAAGQGALALQGRRGEDYGFLDAVRDPVSEEETAAERIFIRSLNCGCGSPAAAYTRISGNEALIAGL